jgi:hypothetical protein
MKKEKNTKKVKNKMSELIPIKEDFSDLCNPDTFNKIIDNLRYYEAQGNTRAIQLFRSAQEEAVRKCGVVIRTINQKRYNGHATPKPKERIIIDYESYEINENGSLSLPQPKPEQPQVPDPIPECLLLLYKNEKEREKKNGNR